MLNGTSDGDVDGLIEGSFAVKIAQQMKTRSIDEGKVALLDHTSVLARSMG